MLSPKIKLYATSTVVALSLLPKIGYFTATNYISVYNKASAYISEATESALRYAGLQAIPNAVEIPGLISSISQKRGLNPALMSALIAQESSGNPDSFSPKLAIGLCQVMPFNAKRCGLKAISELWDTEKNINCGAQILSEELLTYKGNLRKALEAYNGGSGLVGKSSQTAVYAQSVIEKFAQSMAKN